MNLLAEIGAGVPPRIGVEDRAQGDGDTGEGQRRVRSEDRGDGRCRPRRDEAEADDHQQGDRLRGAADVLRQAACAGAQQLTSQQAAITATARAPVGTAVIGPSRWVNSANTTAMKAMAKRLFSQSLQPMIAPGTRPNARCTKA